MVTYVAEFVFAAVLTVGTVAFLNWRVFPADRK